MPLEGKAVGLLVDFIHVAGDAKVIVEVFIGKDMVTNEKLVWREQGLGLFFLAELRGLFKVARYADEALDLVTDISRSSDEIVDLVKNKWMI